MIFTIVYISCILRLEEYENTSYLGDVFFFVRKVVIAVTQKQKRFCQEYARSGNAKQSAINAGYSEKTAYSIGNENLNKPEVKKYLQELTEQIESEKIASAREMQEHLTAIIRKQMEEEVIVVEGCGDGISEAIIKKKTSSIKDIVRAIETLAKMQGVMTNAQVNVCVPVFRGEGDLED